MNSTEIEFTECVVDDATRLATEVCGRPEIIRLVQDEDELCTLHGAVQEVVSAYLAGQKAMRAAVAAEVREECAKWHDQQHQGGHCGESTTEIILRQQRNEWHARAADAIRSNQK